MMGQMTSVLGVLAAACFVTACGGSDSADPAGIAAQAPAAAVPPASAPAVAPAASAPAPAPVVAITTPGTALGPVAQASIGPAGGTVVSADGRLTLTVPAGALAATQTISIQPTSTEVPNGAGLAYRLLPDGLSFALPVRVSFRYDDADVAGSAPEALSIAFQDVQGRWRALASPLLDTQAKAFSGETTHFSEYGLLTGYRIRPANAILGVGKSLGLVTDLCYPADYNGVDVIACRVQEVETFTWAVNGVVGGSAQVGTIDPFILAARFAAPAVAPAANPVAVSAEVTNIFINRGQRTVLVANIWIEGHPPLAGTIISTQVSPLGTGTMTHTTFASVEFQYDRSDEMYRPAAGNVVSRLDYVDPVAGCGYHVAFAGAIGAGDGYISVRDEDGDTPRYGAAGVTIAAHTGTTSCTSNGAVAPLTIEFASARWLPAPPAPNPLIAIPGAMELRAQNDGSLRELITWTPGAGGTETTVQWNLVPH